MVTKSGSESERYAGTDLVEVEWQFDAPDVGTVRRWLENRSHRERPEVGAEEIRELTDTYFDTGDWRLYRAGYALRVRREESSGKGGLEATMKSLASDGGPPGVRRRREISGPVESAEPEALIRTPGPVGECLRSLVEPAALQPIFTVETRRSAYDLSLRGARIGEVVLDETTIPSGDRGEPAHLRRVEIELGADSQNYANLEAFVEKLREGCRLSPATASKYEAGLLARGLAPPAPPKLGPTEVGASLTVGELAFAVMREQFQTFLAHEPGTRVGEDPEELRDMRVATRRLRAAVQIFKQALPHRARKLREELSWVASALGQVRDLDVQLERLEGWISEAAPEDREPLGPLRAVLGEQREDAREAMLCTLDSRRYTRFVESFTDLLNSGPSPRSRAASQPILAVAPDLIADRYREVRKVGDRITGESSAEDYHELRKRGKRLCYALEFHSEVYGDSVRDLVRPLKMLQDMLGDHQDAEAAISYLRGLVADRRCSRELSPQAVFVIGSISHRYEVQARELRARFPKAYEEIKGKRWKKLEEIMEERRPQTTTSET